MLPRFEQFIKERTYLLNVSPATVRWYTHAFKWVPSEMPGQAELNSMVVAMREAGLKATGANAVIRAVNAYLRWAGSACHLKQLKEPSYVPVVFTVEQVRTLCAWKPSEFYDRRLHVLVLLLLDVGCRISEALSVRVADLDLDNLLITLNGKGRKQRKVPISMELRKSIFKYIREFTLQPSVFLLSTKDGKGLGWCVALRDVKRLCSRLGFVFPGRCHAFCQAVTMGQNDPGATARKVILSDDWGHGSAIPHFCKSLGKIHCSLSQGATRLFSWQHPRNFF